MFGLFNRFGWHSLPTNLLERVRFILEEDFEKLNVLAEEHGLFRQEFFRQRDYSDTETQLSLLAFLIGSLGNQLGEREKFTAAETAYNISLKLKHEDNPSIVGLAHLYALVDNLEKARLYAEEALEFLWLHPSMRISESGMMMHVQFSRSIAEVHLQKILGRQLLEHVRSIVHGYQTTSEQKQSLALACLEIGGPQHREALAEYLQITAGIFFDAAYQLAVEQTQRMQEQNSGNLFVVHMQGWENLAGVGGAAAVALAVTKLDPNYIDAWVLASNLRGMGVRLGAGFESQAFELSLEALERIDLYLANDSTVYSRNPDLVYRSGNPSQVTDYLFKHFAKIFRQLPSGSGSEHQNTSANFWSYLVEQIEQHLVHPDAYSALE